MKAQGQSGRGMALSLTDEGAGSGERGVGSWGLDCCKGAASQGPSLHQRGLAAKLCHPRPHPSLSKQARACCCMETGACSYSEVTWLPSSALFVSA